MTMSPLRKIAAKAFIKGFAEAMYNFKTERVKAMAKKRKGCK